MEPRNLQRFVPQKWRHPTAWRTGLFLVALGLILWASRAPRAWVAAAFVFYIVAATLWIRGQHEDNQRRDPWNMPRAGLIGLGVLGVGLFCYRFFLVSGDSETAGESLIPDQLLAAGPVSVLGGFRLRASVVQAARRTRLVHGSPGAARSRPTGARVRVVATSLTGGFLGLVLLGRGPGWTSVLLLLLLLLPPGASLLAENGIESDRAAGHAVRRVGRPLAEEPSWDRHGSSWTASLAAVAVLVFAIVSSTLVDVAIILAVVAFVGITPRQGKASRS